MCDGDVKFILRDFDEENLKNSLGSEKTIQEKLDSTHVSYLYNYLDHDSVDCKKILVEKKYTDKDYLVDYSNYYVRCFEDYERFTNRLHFFSLDFEEDFFIEALKGDEKKVNNLQEEYLGFVIAKPLPEAIIGRTLLKTYDEDGERFYSCKDEKEANLYGIKLKVESLEFQEQDTVAAACATSALWSAFHRTASEFPDSTWVPTPVEITKIATEYSERHRSIPNQGLTLHQMCHAIRKVGLEPNVMELEPVYQQDYKSKRIYEKPALTLLYSYLKIGIPVILHVWLESCGDHHAITLNGYSLKDDQHIKSEVKRKEEKSYFPLIGRRVNKLYAHDDNIGPFCKLEIKDSDQNPYRISAPFEDRDERNYIPLTLIIPLYNKIRVPFMSFYNVVGDIHDFLISIGAIEEDEVVWNLHLEKINDFKEKVLNKDIYEAHREKILLKRLPRFMWKAQLTDMDDNILMEILGDATDMERSFFLLTKIYHNKDLENYINKMYYNIGGAIESLIPKTLHDFFKPS